MSKTGIASTRSGLEAGSSGGDNREAGLDSICCRNHNLFPGLKNLYLGHLSRDNIASGLPVKCNKSYHYSFNCPSEHNNLKLFIYTTCDMDLLNSNYITCFDS
jgi:hypothetical protein